MAEKLTIIDFVEKYVAKYSKNPFLWEKNLDTNVWEPTTYEETLSKAKRIAAGLMALGVQKARRSHTSAKAATCGSSENSVSSMPVL